MTTMKVILFTAVLLLLAGMASADSLTIPDETRVIEAQAFMDDAAVTELFLPEGLEEIHTQAFAGTGVQSVTLPASLKVLAADAFEANVSFWVYPGSAAESLAAEIFLYLFWMKTRRSRHLKM